MSDVSVGKSETVDERDARIHRQYVEGVEARRESWRVGVDILHELPAILREWADVLGEVPTIRIGIEGITIIPRFK